MNDMGNDGSATDIIQKRMQRWWIGIVNRGTCHDDCTGLKCIDPVHFSSPQPGGLYSIAMFGRLLRQRDQQHRKKWLPMVQLAHDVHHSNP
jgi:hypothetical protein